MSPDMPWSTAAAIVCAACLVGGGTAAPARWTRVAESERERVRKARCHMNEWLKKKLDIFELRVRAARGKCRDIYYCAGWADGYKAAQRDARKAEKGTKP